MIVTVAKDYEPLNVKLYAGEDDDLINWLSDKPKAYFVKRALRVYMNEIFENVTKEMKEEKQSPLSSSKDDDYDDLEGLT